MKSVKIVLFDYPKWVSTWNIIITKKFSTLNYEIDFRQKKENRKKKKQGPKA